MEEPKKTDNRKNADDRRRSFQRPPTKGKRPGQQFRQDDDFNWNKVLKVVLSWSAIILLVFLVMTLFRGTEGTEVPVSYTEYQQLLQDNKIAEATIRKSEFANYDFHGVLKEPASIVRAGKQTSFQKFTLTLPILDSGVIKEWNERGIRFSVEKEDNAWVSALVSALPWVLLLVVWFIIMRRMQGAGPRGIFSFGKSRAKMLNEGAPKVTFLDVAGADEAKLELMEIIEFLKEPTKFQKLGGKIPRGVLLLGPPGTGKTLLARAVAGEAGVPFFSISGADFVEMFVGVGASRVRDLFEQGKKSAPCIIFIDEIDAVGRHRGAGLGGGHDEREQTLNQLLVEMDGFEQNSGVIIIAATNRPDVLDPALMRPGRFDRQVVVDRPDVKGREGILRVHTKNIPLGDDVKLETLAKGTPGLAGADLANLVNEAALLAARQNDKAVSMRHFEEAKDKVMMGMERKSLIISEKEKKITSYHEIGHVLVARMIPEADPVHKVTIIPRGRALGLTTYLPIDEKHTYSKAYLEAMITYALGGRAAEQLIFHELTTGAGNDIERSTELARKMVCEWGMSEKLGPLAYGQKDEEIFLGRQITRHRNYSEQTAITIDDEIKKIVSNGMRRAEKILTDNIDILHRLASALLEREILDASEIDAVIRGDELPPLDKGGNGVKPKEETIRSSVTRHGCGSHRGGREARFQQMMNELPNVEQSYTTELIRKGIHLCSLSIPVVYYWISRELALSILIPIAIVLGVLDVTRLFHPATGRLFSRYLGFLLRPHEQTERGRNLNGATYVLLSAILCIWILPKVVVITAFAVLIISDTCAALIGRRFGRRRFFNKKSVAGSSAFIISGLLVVAFAPKILELPGEYVIGAVAVLIGAIVEASPIPMDDNLSIPIAIGASMWTMYAAFLPAVDVFALDRLF